MFPRFFRIFFFSIGAVSLSFGLSSSNPSHKASEPARKVDQNKLVALGKALFRDKSLSEPAGLACISCHSPETGYSYPNPWINFFYGTVPGSIPTRFGFRRPPSLAYSPYMATGFPHWDEDAQAYVGGLFWDGRAQDGVDQAKQPLFNPNEMNNQLHGVGSPEMIARKLKVGANAGLFKEAYGENSLNQTADKVLDMAVKAIVAYEASPEVSPFTSKYDAYLEGKATLTTEELVGLRFVTGTIDGRPNGLPFRKSAHCMDCHGESTDLKKGPDLWTNSCYANLGVPKNESSPYFRMSDSRRNPYGYNDEGEKFTDLGMGGYLYSTYGPAAHVLEILDPLRINGTFKAPSLRNVDKRPYPGFVKSYMHNGYFKSLKEVVHFYNTRNLTTVPGEVIDFTKSDPYAGLKGKPLWPRPEYLNPSSLINPTGMASGKIGSKPIAGQGPDLDAQQIGNLKLTEWQENDIVAFLKCLSDGYYEREKPLPWSATLAPR